MVSDRFLKIKAATSASLTVCFISWPKGLRPPSTSHYQPWSGNTSVARRLKAWVTMLLHLVGKQICAVCKSLGHYQVKLFMQTVRELEKNLHKHRSLQGKKKQTYSYHHCKTFLDISKLPIMKIVSLVAASLKQHSGAILHQNNQRWS